MTAAYLLWLMPQNLPLEATQLLSYGTTFHEKALAFEVEEMKCFPVLKTRSIGLRWVRRCSKVVPQCVCRMPRESTLADIRCGMCQKWFHSNCIQKI